MPPIFDKPTTEKYDYVVIGGGSGGSGSSVSTFVSFRSSFISDFCLLTEKGRFLWQEGCCGRGYTVPWRYLC